MEFIIEIILEFIFDGTLELVTAKKVPLFIRVLSAVVLLVFYIGFGGLLLYIGIKNKSRIVTGIAIVLLIIVAIVVVRNFVSRA